MSDKNIVSVEKTLPERIFIIPLMEKPIFPGIFMPIMITSKEDIEVIEGALNASGGFIGMLLVDRKKGEEKTAELFKVGTVAKIVKKINLPDGGINVFVSTIRRFNVTKMISSKSPYSAEITYPEDLVDVKSDEIKALTRSLVSEMKQVSENNPLFSEEMRLNMVNIDHPGKIADFITSILNIGRLEQQKILEMLNVRDRMEQVLVYIKREQELLKIQRKIAIQINERIEKSQREYFLREELKAIKRELGEPMDPKSMEHDRLKKKLKALPLEGEAKEQVTQELEKFSLMEPSSSEYVVTRNYLDTIVNLPWGTPPPEKINIRKAKTILEEDHYGLEDVKERILEYLAAKKLKGDTKGSIICLVGPPGVGKTSIGKSIANSLKRPFFRFSVGGMRDEGEIKGHRRTYVGAMPGKIIQGLKIVKSKAPVFMIDEIDKLGPSFQGDPSSALLEVLDPEQNMAFRDHYLDLPYDLSYVFFIATANTLDSIPPPLMDRMEIIRLSGYIESEKIEIAKRYLLPKSLERNGLQKSHVRYSDATLKMIMRGYARDAGMRTYEKSLDKIHRKIAKKIALKRTNSGSYSVTRTNLEDYLGKPLFREEELKRSSVPGTAVGLAWTQFGGDTLLVEAVVTPGKGGIQLTGRMGDVMKESANIAYTHVKAIAMDYGIQPSYFDEHTIHLHIPEGATPKDGPSAGITMASALLSLVRKKKIRTSLAMTGELSLVGKVLPIGGLKEKTIAARRNRIRHIIIPSQNQRDLDEIPEHVREGIEYHPVTTMREVIQAAFQA